MKPTDRRSFMKASLAGGFVLSATSTQERPIQGFETQPRDPTASEGWQPVSDRKIRVGLVGYGVCKFAVDFSFQHHPNVEIVAVSDLIPERCAALAKVVKCRKTYPSLEELVKDPRIEAVFVATDAPSHAEHAIAALTKTRQTCGLRGARRL
ncbi:MAG TPA: Gfo/Idh/MocA family oxidoreductase [Acidobacteriota bacterium]|nr:Gfo/Idh/MocA family oxidoreductase [Acidobacteriota bacterium]